MAAGAWAVIIRADARHIPLADKSIQCVVTSPPYWGLRSYGIGVDAGEIGLEATPEAYVATMVQVFREVWRVLRDDGTVWLNLGDSYAGGGTKGDTEGAKQKTSKGATWVSNDGLALLKNNIGVAPKNLIGIPWRVAFALQADGWYLRSDIIWAKPNPMPESVTDRPTRSHEYIFLLSKSERYFYDADAIREPSVYPDDDRKGRARIDQKRYPGAEIAGVRNGSATYRCRNKRDVWTVNSEATREAHFATFPQKLIEPCILAGSRVGDVCFDPFLGSGTVGKVCERLGRRWVGLELSPQYIEIAKRRTVQQGLFGHKSILSHASEKGGL